jgi:subtilisin-like proprotein convertase family protein
LSDTTFIPDGPDCNPSNPCYESSVIFTDFPIGSTVESVEDLLYLRINFEHSFIGDLEIKLICPDSKSVTILPKYGTYTQFSGSGPNYPPSIPASSSYTSYNITPGFGVPIFTDNGCTPESNAAGTGWNYCWSSNTTLGYQFAGGNIYAAANCNSGLDNDVTSSYVFIADSSNMQTMSNLYVPYQSFSLLEGCPLNGEWKIQVCDTWAVDNGWIFEWELALDPDILPATWSYSASVYNVDWSLGTNATTELVTNSPLVYKLKPSPSLGSGNYTGTFTVNDAFGCGTAGSISYSVEGVSAISGIQTGDYICTGFLNNNWIDGSEENWLVKTESGYDHALNVPEANSNVFIINYCSNNNPVIVSDLACKDVTINVGKTLTMSNQTFNVAGNWANFGTFEAGAGTVVFNGSSTQGVNAGGNAFNNMVIQKPSGLLALSSDVAVNNQLSMISGNVSTNGNLLTLGTGIANRGVLNYTSGQIRGKLKRWFAASTNTASEGFFPMGNGTLYRPTEIEYKSAPSLGGSLIVMFNENPMGWQNSNLIPPISTVGSCPAFLVTTFSNQGYWQVDPADGLTGGIYDITLYANGMTSVSNLCKLTALKRVGSGNWTTSGTHVEPFGTIENPIVKRTGASGWSNWGVGGSEDNPLLVNLLSYSLNCTSTGVVIDWSTASEVNNNFFTIERSNDGERFEEVVKIDATGNSNTVRNYQYVDAGIQSDNSYYRLTQTDFDGMVSVLGIKAVSCNNMVKVYLIIPNPFNDKITIQGLTEVFVPIDIFDYSGTLVYSDKVNFITGENLNLSTLASGIYWVRLLDVDGVVHQFKIIKN